MMTTDRTETRSAILPTDPFEVALADKLGHPDGAHTQPSVVQAVDFYGNATSYILQTVKWAEGTTAFVTQVNAQGSARFVLPPKVVAVLLRQQEQVVTIVRRRQGKRLAEERRATGQLRVGGFTPEMRTKAAATRRAKATRRAARKAARA
jgi:hypothetical protein